MWPYIHFDLSGDPREHGPIGDFQHNIDDYVMEQQVRVVADVSSLGVVISTLMGFLPPIAAIASIIWSGIQIYEWYKKKRGKR